MVRQSILFLACAALLVACNRSPLLSGPSRPEAPAELRMAAPPPPDIAIGGGAGAQQFSYSHTWTLVMAHDAVAARFDRAREFCLRDTALDCKLVSANLNNSGGDNPYSYAELQVLLPHGMLDRFEKALLAPVGHEKSGDAVLQSRNTQAQSVENEAGDAGQKVAQLTAYRDRLAQLAARPNLSVDDIIKLEAEQARVQGELDDALSHKRDLSDSIARESLSITLSERAPPQAGPVTQALQNAGETFLYSTAVAVGFVIGVVPWLPIIAAAIYLLLWLLRLFRRRQKVIVAPEKTAGG
jgi:hypothetical protein